jgi:hypothetical protein
MSMAMNHGSEVIHEIKKFVPIHIVQMATLTMIHNKGIRAEMGT